MRALIKTWHIKHLLSRSKTAAKDDLSQFTRHYSQYGMLIANVNQTNCKKTTFKTGWVGFVL